MRPEVYKYLYDVSQACEAVIQFTRGKTLEDYLNDLLLRSGTERQLMIIGEALNQAANEDETISGKISDLRRIVNLRNVIVHSYATVEDETVWGMLQEDVPKLYEQVKKLL
jgi:uncharacterized protein with HEPN domain